MLAFRWKVQENFRSFSRKASLGQGEIIFGNERWKGPIFILIIAITFHKREIDFFSSLQQTLTCEYPCTVYMKNSRKYRIYCNVLNVIELPNSGFCHIFHYLPHSERYVEVTVTLSKNQCTL